MPLATQSPSESREEELRGLPRGGASEGVLGLGPLGKRQYGKLGSGGQYSHPCQSEFRHTRQEQVLVSPSVTELGPGGCACLGLRTVSLTGVKNGQ